MFVGNPPIFFTTNLTGSRAFPSAPDSDDDYWMNYYKGGQAQYGAIEIVYHDFDERKLAGDPVEDAGQAYSYEQKEVGA